MFRKYTIEIDGEKYFPEVHVNDYRYVLTEERSHSVMRGIGTDNPDEIFYIWVKRMERQASKGIENPKYNVWT